MHILQVREYKPNHTDGEIFINGGEGRFCHSLEDPGRPTNVKIAGQTCVGEGHYSVEVSHSRRFKKKMLLLYNMPDKSIERDGKRFTGVRIHGVTTVDDTRGCIGAMYAVDGQGGAWSRASDDLCDIVENALARGEKVTWTITS